MTSVICVPIVRIGFIDAMGSWDTMLISRPRTLRATLLSRSDRPLHRTSPPMIRPGNSISPRAARAMVLLPDPDSPTIPSDSPASTVKETSRTAWTVPPRAGKTTSRLRISRRWSPCLIPTSP